MHYYIYSSFYLFNSSSLRFFIFSDILSECIVKVVEGAWDKYQMMYLSVRTNLNGTCTSSNLNWNKFILRDQNLFYSSYHLIIPQLIIHPFTNRPTHCIYYCNYYCNYYYNCNYNYNIIYILHKWLHFYINFISRISRYIRFSRTMSPTITSETRRVLVDCYRRLRQNDILGMYVCTCTCSWFLSFIC